MESNESQPDTPLKVLGRKVKRRRVKLQMKYAKDLAKKMDITPRVVGDIENGRRSVSEATYDALELVLEWAPGSVDQILAGGEPTESESPIKDFAIRTHGAPSDVAPDAERLFGEWADLYTQLLPVEFRYATTRGLDLAEAQEELRDILDMAQNAAKDGRMWTPPWKWNRPGRPWSEAWWKTKEAAEFHAEVRRAFGAEYDKKERLKRTLVSDPDESLPAAANEGAIEEPGEFNT